MYSVKNIENKNCVYFHKKPNSEIFYIGIGDKTRPFQIKGRNKWWHNIVNKYGYDIVIIHENLTWEEACIFEKTYINKYGRKDLGLGPLVNLTNGGEGGCGRKPGFKHSEETKQKQSMSHFASKKTVSEETKKKIAESVKGNTSHKGFLHSAETKKSISSNKKRKLIDSTGIFYPSVEEAAEIYGISKTHLSNMLNGKRTNKTNLNFA